MNIKKKTTKIKRQDGASIKIRQEGGANTHENLLNDFLRVYKKFHKGDRENWRKSIADKYGRITRCEKISTDKEYAKEYYGKGKHFDIFKKKVMPKVEEYIERCGTSELKALIKCTDPNEFWRQWTSFQSEVWAYLFLRDRFENVTHPKSGYDFEFTYNNEKYRVECVAPQRGKSGLQVINCSKMQIRSGQPCDVEHEKKALRITNALKNKTKQLKKIEGHEKGFNFIFIDLTTLFWGTGAIGFSHKNIEDLLYSQRNGNQISREETKIKKENGYVYTYDFSFSSDNMKYIHGIFITDSASLLDKQRKEVNLYINTGRGLPSKFLETIQSSKEFQVHVHDPVESD
ncbi:MAG: hypothetical protein OXB96_01110 [Candidatus Kaiserbacteria bacterium]|nr:hypothetical protein [Candidatus Kaiserbacteria bacterium]